jgi:AraC-like DNA-binding protein
MDKIREGLLFKANLLQQSVEPKICITRKPDSVQLLFQFSGPQTMQEQYYRFMLEISYTYLTNLTPEHRECFNWPDTIEMDVCCSTQVLLFDMLNTKYHSVYKQIYLEAKALELLLATHKVYLEHITPEEGCKFLSHAEEREKIISAREIILNRLDNPPTIPELARVTGMNQCYLKKGFKEVYGMTIYEFVQEQRMMKAKILLTSADYSISSVAEMVGFSSVSNFSTAFKKYTGILPSEFSQN